MRCNITATQHIYHKYLLLKYLEKHLAVFYKYLIKKITADIQQISIKHLAIL